jgi:hypothetical protein
MKWKTIVLIWIGVVIISLLGCIYTCSVNEKKNHNRSKYSSESSKISESINGLPKDYTIEYNEFTKSYRWCNHGDSWLFKYCSRYSHSTKEEAIRQAYWNDNYLKPDNQKWKKIN